MVAECDNSRLTLPIPNTPSSSPIRMLATNDMECYA